VAVAPSSEAPMKKPSLTKLFGLPSIASPSHRSFLSALVLGTSVALFASCSGTPQNQTTSHDDANAEAPVSTAQDAGAPNVGAEDAVAQQGDAVATPASAQDPASAQEGTTENTGGTQDTLQEQRRVFLLKRYKSEARKALADRRFDDAKFAAGTALQIDPADDEAKQLLQKAQALSGDAEANIGVQAETSLLRAQIEKQRAEAQAREYERDGDFLMEKEDFEKARQSYEKALLTIRYSPWFTPGSEQERNLEVKEQQAENARDELAARIANREARETREQLAEAERAQRNRVRTKVRELFDQANLAFQNRQYGESVTYLDRALAYDPLNTPAQELRELALRARQDRDMATVNARWRTEWVKTFEDIEQGNVMQEKVIEHDLRHWEKVKTRGPLEFSSWDVAEDPDNEAVRTTLANTRVSSDFPEATLDEWVDYYRRATRLTFVISPRLRELGDEEIGLSRFRAPLQSVEKTLNLISRVRPIRWRVKDGVVHLLSTEEGGGNIVPKIYPVGEIINPISQYAGKDLAQKFGDSFFEEEMAEPEPVVVDMDRLQSLIQTNVDPMAWEVEGASMEATMTALIINQTPEVHRKIDKLLSDLRRTSGVQVDIEARFLSVETTSSKRSASTSVVWATRPRRARPASACRSRAIARALASMTMAATSRRRTRARPARASSRASSTMTASTATSTAAPRTSSIAPWAATAAWTTAAARASSTRSSTMPSWRSSSARSPRRSGSSSSPPRAC
jgi:hypothetical protein